MVREGNRIEVAQTSALIVVACRIYGAFVCQFWRLKVFQKGQTPF